MQYLRHINISDLHIGSQREPSEYSRELIDIIDYIDKVRDELNVLTLAGDLFDRVFPANHKAVKMVIDFVQALRIRAEAYKFIIFIVKGTESHDSSQLDILKGMEEEGVLYIIKDVSFYEIGGLLFRFIPEYYSKSYDELYQKAFTSKADVTVYHGAIEGAAFYLKNDLTSQEVNQAQIIRINDLVETTGLYTVCGHIHNRVNLRKNIWYTGSYTSHSFSDAGSEKGFDDIRIDLETGDYSCKFVRNRKATNYMILDATDVFKNSPLSKVKGYFASLKLDTNSSDEIRIDIDANMLTDEEYKCMETVVSTFKSHFKFNISRQIVQSRSSESIISDAEYVLNPKVSIYEKIKRIISDEYDYEIEISEIMNLLDIPTNDK